MTSRQQESVGRHGRPPSREPETLKTRCERKASSLSSARHGSPRHHSPPQPSPVQARGCCCLTASRSRRRSPLWGWDGGGGGGGAVRGGRVQGGVSAALWHRRGSPCALPYGGCSCWAASDKLPDAASYRRCGDSVWDLAASSYATVAAGVHHKHNPAAVRLPTFRLFLGG